MDYHRNIKASGNLINAERVVYITGMFLFFYMMINSYIHLL
ncbi:hypothetical protein B4153_4672 [Bacillus cereus]|uniref:Uncharacterized protein n=1 Tax=Bacillus cereus (strain AH187) TaxID=405534 RepID=B7HQL8_BACC7|nr:hypothetical protein BCAH187_A4594 [Bacillus cereus AH187]EEK98532.1 hypothetical protein bcere0013_42920 [Bacillus cereus BDRD-ST26]KKZ90172.1 hypothetical protein B4153_4672 [Bacillus cereus]KLA18045.1 hypothetical protein B4078_4303 [Bacillus cereus]KZD44199.1 hypothetical protein B4085_5396 [Bacillus cereus]